MRLFFCFASFLTLLFPSIYAGTVRIFNDSSFKLRAVVRGADGSYLGEMVITPTAVATWTDSLQQYGHNPESNNQLKNSAYSQTPYTVVFYCMDGSDFSTYTNVATGGFVQAQMGEGKKSCQGANQKNTFKP